MWGIKAHRDHKSQDPRMVWVGRTLKDYPVPPWRSLSIPTPCPQPGAGFQLLGEVNKGRKEEKSKQGPIPGFWDCQGFGGDHEFLPHSKGWIHLSKLSFVCVHSLGRGIKSGTTPGPESFPGGGWNLDQHREEIQAPGKSLEISARCHSMVAASARPKAVFPAPVLFLLQGVGK